MARWLLLALTGAVWPGCGDGAGDAATQRDVYTVVARDLEWRLVPDVDVEATGGVGGVLPGAETVLPLQRVARDAVSSDGVRLISPCQASFVLRVQAGDRLRLRFVRALPAEGETGPELTLRDADGLLDTSALSWRASDDWQEVELDLAPLAGREARLQLSVGPEPGEVLIGQVLQLRRATVAHPNVILYVEDALRADHLGSYGYEQPTDPHLRQIAGDGVRFRQSFAAANWTRPAVSTLLTGLDAGDHGNTANGSRIPDAAVTLAEIYADAGYLTAAFVTNIHAGVWSGLERGFDLHYDMKAFPRSRRDSSLTSDLINELLLAFLERHRDELLFVYVHSTDPHEPYRSLPDDLFAVMDAGAPRRVPERVPKERGEQWSEWTLNYDGEIHHNDRSLRLLDQQLVALGLMQDTLLAFTSDHGEGFYEHGNWGHRQTLYQEEVAVPWVLRWPAALPAGRVVDEPAGHVDMAPTLLALSGLQRPANWRGRDLSGLCRDIGSRSGEVSAPRPLLIWGGTPDGPAVACVLPPWKLVAVPDEDGQPRPVSLHDLREDPHERRDRLNESELRPLVDELLASVRDYMDRHARASGGPSDATGLSGLDQEDLDWLREMGYLR